MSTKRVAIFGGTFDPPHLGHFIIAEQIQTNFNLDKIIFMPAGMPPHKKDKIISNDKARFEMLKLVIDKNDKFDLSNWELKQDGYSYTAKTLKDFVPTIEAEEVFFIIGADSLADIFKWKNTEYLLSEAKFIVFSRNEYNLEEILKKQRYQPYLDNILSYKNLKIEISSSFIREEIKKNKSIRYLTVEEICNYINKNKLYR